jgi:DNA-binding MarR family transcriptional regulator
MADAKTIRALQVVARSLRRAGREPTRAAGALTPQQAEALHTLLERGVLSTSSFAELLAIDPSTASRNLSGLERAGLVVRRRGTEDGRQTDVCLTPRGRRTAEALASDRRAAYSALLDRVPRADRDRVEHALAILAQALSDDRRS